MNNRNIKIISEVTVQCLNAPELNPFIMDCGEEKYKLIFNQIISPRDAVTVKSKCVTILWSTLSVFTSEKFKPDHIVPMVFIDDNAKAINESKKIVNLN